MKFYPKLSSAFLVLAGSLFLTSVCHAEATWSELNNQVIEMYQKKFYTKAIPVAEEALTLANTQYGKTSAEAVLSMNNLGLLYKKKKRYAEAEKMFKQSLTLSEKIAGRSSPDLCVPLNNLALLYASQGNKTQALKISQRALLILENHFGKSHEQTLAAKKRYDDMIKSMEATA